MKWITVFEDGKRQTFLNLDEIEVKSIAKMLKKLLKGYQRKLESLQGIHELGEATARQQTRLMKTEENIDLIERFIKNAEL